MSVLATITTGIGLAQCPSGGPPAIVTVTAGASAQASNCIQTSGTITISGGGVGFAAGSSIYLQPGFHAIAGTSGSAFEAYIAPYITTSSLPTGVAGTAYPTTTLAATGASGQYRWSSAGLPANLVLSTAGLLSGTPQAAGTSQVTIVVTDAVSGKASSATFSLTVNSPAGNLSLPVTSGNVGASGGTISNIAVTASPGVTWSATTGDSWLGESGGSGTGSGSFNIAVGANTSTASRTGTVSVSGAGVTVTYTVNEAGGLISASPTSLSVTSGASTPAITLVDSGGLSWTTQSSDPSWLTVSPASGAVSGTITLGVSANSGQARSANVLILSSATVVQTIPVQQATGAAGASSASQRDYIRAGSRLIAIETGQAISAPSTPAGPSTCASNFSFVYSTGGSVSSLPGDTVQYLIDWGDGSNTGWLAAGVSGANHAWSANGTYTVKAQARSSLNASIVSVYSQPRSVLVENDIAPILTSFSSTPPLWTDPALAGVVTDAGGTIISSPSSDLQRVDILLSSNAGNCHIGYFPRTNGLGLDSDAGNDNWTMSSPPPANYSIYPTYAYNSTCEISFTHSSALVASDEQTLTLTAQMYFLKAGIFAESLRAMNGAGTAGYANMGSMTVPAIGTFYIDGTESGDTYHTSTQDPYVLSLYTNTPNAVVQLCGVWNGTTLPCTTLDPNQGAYTTDSSGYWDLPGNVSQGFEGNWEAWFNLSYNGVSASSNHIYYTVVP